MLLFAQLAVNIDSSLGIKLLYPEKKGAYPLDIFYIFVIPFVVMQGSSAPLPRPPAAPDSEFEENFLGAVGCSSTLPPPAPEAADTGAAAQRPPPQPIDLLVPSGVRVVAVTGTSLLPSF